MQPNARQVARKGPQHNEFGVYLDHTDTIREKTKSGATIEINLVDTGNGWIVGYSLLSSWAGYACPARTGNQAYSDRQAAIDGSIDSIKSLVTGGYHDDSERQNSMRREVLIWCESQKQMELF